MEKIVRRYTLEDVLQMIKGLESLATDTRLKASREGDRPTMEWARGYLSGLAALRNLINDEMKKVT